MRKLLPVALALVLLGSLVKPAVAAESKAVQTMAAILSSLNHMPSDADKAALKKLLDDSTTTAQERVVAQAIMNVQHRVSAEDKAKLDTIIKDESASASLKTLASVIVSLNHTPSEADKAKLKGFAS